MKLKSKLVISFIMIILIPMMSIGMIFLLINTTDLNATERISALVAEMRSFPGWKEMLLDFTVCIAMILLLTAVMLSVWLYRSMISPIRKLQEATKSIQDGNLDFVLEAESEDEIGELSRDFEEMRKRLKESSEEKLNAEMENRELVRNISHDLKTPITSIKGYAEGILDGVADTPEKQEKYVRTILSKATEMTTLLNELTIYSQIDTNRIPYHFSRLNAVNYFNDCAEEVGMDLENKNIRFHFYCNVEPDVDLIADPEQLARVIHNIINNSVKYMDKQDRVIHLRVQDVGDFVQVEIEDNGKGIAVHEIPYVFDRFYRTDASRNSATGGSGIGLSIAKKIIEDHGGKIWVSSKEGFGTTMYFVIRQYIEPDPVVIKDVKTKEYK